MKSLSSTSSPASSTTAATATTFDGNICNSKSAAGGCLTGVLRRLVCFSSLPTHPSDHIKEACDKSTECEKLHYREVEDQVEELATTGLVARLMGLDSMPRIDLANTQITPNSITRSRSMNSMDTWREFESMQGNHRRVHSALSFRGPPTFLELENDEFFILSFENEAEIKELGSKPTKSEMGFVELKQRRADKCKNTNKRRESVYEKNKENQETNKASDEKQHRMVTPQNASKVKDLCNILRPTKNSHENAAVTLEVEVVEQSKPINHKQNIERRKSRKKKECCSPVKKVETEYDSENSSPVSVLDFGEFPINREVPTSVVTEEDSRLISSNSRRKFSEKLESYKHSAPSNTTSSIIDDREAKSIEGKCVGSRKIFFKSQNHVEMWGEMCKSAYSDVLQSNWIYRQMWKLKDFEEIGAAVGLEILDQMLFELVDQLTSTSKILNFNTA